MTVLTDTGHAARVCFVFEKLGVQAQPAPAGGLPDNERNEQTR